jgi:hypothetical protein
MYKYLRKSAHLLVKVAVGRGWHMNDQQAETKQRRKWSHHHTHVTELYSEQFIRNRCCIEKQLINHIKTEL